jgi:hypothetical protein
MIAPVYVSGGMLKKLRGGGGGSTGAATAAGGRMADGAWDAWAGTVF